MLPKVKIPKKIVYLDHAATTPVDPKVEKAMKPFWNDRYGNPSSLYRKGTEAKEAISKARNEVAKILNCAPSEIIFTAGGTESTNLAIFGIARKHEPKQAHIITTTIEHHAVLHPVMVLEKEGYTATYLPVDKSGIVMLEDLKGVIRPETVLVSVMYANNEVGTIQPIEEIGRWLKAENTRRAKKNLPYINFHVDACQAGGSLNLDVKKLTVDLFTLNGSKIYGPKQTGVLFVRIGIRLQPLIHGGGQEKGFRSGTENVPGIIGFAAALALSQHKAAAENARLKKLRDYFIKRILKEIPDSFLNGSAEEGRRLPNNINITFDHVDGEALLLYLDGYNICVSTGSACSTDDNMPSHVLRAMGTPLRHIRGAIRFTMGGSTTKQELDYVLKVLTSLVKELRGMK